MSLCEIFKIFYSVSNLDRSQNTRWLKLGLSKGYYHMAKLLVKIPCAVFLLKVVLNYSAIKGFHIYDTKSQNLFFLTVLTVSKQILEV